MKSSNILITAASKHGSTWQIAQVMARVLRQQGFSVKLKKPEDITSLTGYDAVIIGSAIYSGGWRPEARDFVYEHSLDLVNMPVWLFSSGPLKNPNGPINIRHSDELAILTSAQDHKVFSGRLTPAGLSLRERMLVRMRQAAFGDFREWGEIIAWTKKIAVHLRARQLVFDRS